jgi:serine/threonine protein phosphatase 1
MQLSEVSFERIIAVGDMHGHRESLIRMLKKIDLRKGDFIIFIGDYIDRGPRSKELVQELIDLQKSHTDSAFIRGNHEDMLLGTLGYSAVVSDMSTWLYNGGFATLRSYGLDMNGLNRIMNLWNENERLAALAQVIPEEHVDFFCSLELYVETEHFFFCHAGVDPAGTIEQGKLNHHNLLWMREHLYAEEQAWEKKLVCGHTPLRDIFISDKLICIDTGLHYDGCLSAIDVKSMEVFQVRQG